MNLEQLPATILFVLVVLVAGLGLWALAIRFNSSRLKIIAVMVGGFPILGLTLQLALSRVGVSYRPDFKTSTPGPPSRDAFVNRDFPFPVNNPNVQHELDLTPTPRAGDVVAGQVAIECIIRSPQGVVLGEIHQTVAPAQGRAWSTITARFQPTEAGEHSLSLRIPQPVGGVNVVVREISK